MKNRKVLLIPFFVSLLVFLLTSWTAAISSYSALWAESVSFFALSYFMLERYAKDNTYGIPVILMIMIGRVILEIPIRIHAFYASLHSLYITIVVLLSIILSAVYYHEKRLSVLVLSIVIMILLNTVGYDGWVHLIGH